MGSFIANRRLPLKCACGKVEAYAEKVNPLRVNHVVCGCRYCRAYARHLGREHEILDAHGGTEVFQLSPRDLKFLGGDENIACLRITRKGALRWYADCCDTPIANTFESQSMPFVGIPCAFVDRERLESPLNSYLGPVAVRVNTTGPAPSKGVVRLAAVILRFGAMLAWWRLRGDHKHSPFFDYETGAPHRTPEIALFSAEDRKMLQAPPAPLWRRRLARLLPGRRNAAGKRS